MAKRKKPGDVPDLTPAELDLVAEQVAGKPHTYGSAAEAVEAMQKRLKVLLAEKSETVAALDDCADEIRPGLLKDLDDLNRQILETQKRIEEAQFQKRAEN